MQISHDPKKIPTSRSEATSLQSSDAGDARGRLHKIADVSHQLMGSVSALVMCQHLILKELKFMGPLNSVLAESLALLKDSIDQVHLHGDHLMALSRDPAATPSA